MPRPSRAEEVRPTVTFETVRTLVLQLPGVVEGTSYGTPAFRAGKTLLVRQHQDGESLVVRIEPDQRAMRMRAEPETYFITDHYLNYPWMLVRLATIDQDDLRDLLQESWRLCAPKRFLATRASLATGNSRRSSLNAARGQGTSGICELSEFARQRRPRGLAGLFVA